MKGHFSEESLQRFSQLASESAGVNYAENTYDFARCLMSDGSYYGVSKGEACKLGKSVPDKKKSDDANKEKKKPRKINKDTVSNYQIPTAFYDRLKDGEDFTAPDGQIIKNEEVTLPTSPCRSYVYSADTIYDRNIAELSKGANLLYHETTYVKTMTENALLRFHSTTHQAASIALEACVDKLIIGHFSSKYEKLEVYLEEAKEVFTNTHLAIEGVTHII